jgi:hypothetical protein
VTRKLKRKGPKPRPADNGESPGEPSDEQRDKFYQRAGESHGEARRLLTAMAVGSLGVLYATLIPKDAPDLGAYSKALALGIAFSMVLSAGFGLTAWRADAAWAYQSGEVGKKSGNRGRNRKWECLRSLRMRNWREKSLRLTQWHCIKKWCDRVQLASFGVGLFLAALLTLELILGSPEGCPSAA